MVMWNLKAWRFSVGCCFGGDLEKGFFLLLLLHYEYHLWGFIWSSFPFPGDGREDTYRRLIWFFIILHAWKFFSFYSFSNKYTWVGKKKRKSYLHML
ncbi:hypothetical protein F5X99DRAFT_132827 [Biscogniauxia marginata]|nr:hypothetical protein F5X99DRAFT_132827 [Biscogniauxia marginata]